MSDVLPEVDIAYPLFHHEVDRVDGVLDVLRLCSKEVTDGWDAVALLCLSDIFQIVHKSSYMQLLVVVCICQGPGGTIDAIRAVTRLRQPIVILT